MDKYEIMEMQYADMEIPNETSSVLPLCITVILCLIAGIALGIIMAKRTINKQ